MRRPLAEPTLLAPRAGRSYAVADDGRITVDPAKRDIWPYTLVTEPEEVFVPKASVLGPESAAGGPILVAGGVVPQPVVMPIDEKGPFEAVYFSATARFLSGSLTGQPTDQYTVVIFDPEFRPLLMNRDVHVRAITGGFGSALGSEAGAPPLQGAAGRPLVLPETFFMEPADGGKAVFLGFRNLTTEDIGVRFVAHGVRYYHVRAYEEARRRREEFVGRGRVSWPYFYTTDTDVDLAPSEGREFDIRVTDDADVEVFKLTKFSDSDFLGRFQEKDSGKRFLDTAGPGVGGAPNGVHSELMFGDGEFPFIPFETMYWEQNYKVMLVLTNLDPVNRNRIFPTLVCRKIAHAGRE